MQKKIIIVAMTKDRVIGKNGKLPWHISEDLRLFKMLTLGNTVVMGRATFDSIGKPLPKRTNIVVSATARDIPGAAVSPTFEEAVAKAEGLGRDMFFIGGASIYRQALAIADEMHISWIKGDYAGDTSFPGFDQSAWEILREEDYPEFRHVVYVKNIHPLEPVLPIRTQQPVKGDRR